MDLDEEEEDIAAEAEQNEEEVEEEEEEVCYLLIGGLTCLPTSVEKITLITTVSYFVHLWDNLSQGRIESFCQPQTFTAQCYKMAKFTHEKA